MGLPWTSRTPCLGAGRCTSGAPGRLDLTARGTPPAEENVHEGLPRLVESSIANRALDGVDTLLADDVVFTSPVAFPPYPGKALTAAILDGVARVFTDFRYVSTIEEGNRSAQAEARAATPPA